MREVSKGYWGHSHSREGKAESVVLGTKSAWLGCSDRKVVAGQKEGGGAKNSFQGSYGAWFSWDSGHKGAGV